MPDELPSDRMRFNPVTAFTQTLSDFHEMTNLYRMDNSPITTREYLTAADTLGQRLKAISIFSMNAEMSRVIAKIPSEEIQRYQEEMEVADMMESPEDEIKRMIQSIVDVAETQHDDGV